MAESAERIEQWGDRCSRRDALEMRRSVKEDGRGAECQRDQGPRARLPRGGRR